MRFFKKTKTTSFPTTSRLRSLRCEPLEDRRMLSVTTPSDAALQMFHTQDALFAENAGQWASDEVYFGYNKGGTQIYFTDDGLEFGLSRNAGSELHLPGEGDVEPEVESTYFSLHFDGAEPTAPIGADPSETVFNYHLGAQENWVDSVSTYKTVVYNDLYTGIDLHTFSRHGEMKYEFHVSPGADYTQIELSYADIDGLSIDADGSLHIATALGEIVDEGLYIYQTIDGRQVEVAGQFTLLDADTYTFTVTGDYDPTAELVIDPNIDWGSYLGESSDEYAYGVAVDSLDNILLSGCTESANWISGGYDTSLGGNHDAFVVKLDSNGNHLWSTYLGGSDSDYGLQVAVDPFDNILVTGDTASSDWISGGYDTTYGGSTDAFVVKLASDGSHLWSTYLGENKNDYGHAITTDSLGNVLVTGNTLSTNWISGGYDTTLAGSCDAFVVKLGVGGNHIWSTYLGGDVTESGFGIAVDLFDNVLVTGETYSSNWISGGHDENHGGIWDGFVVKLASDGSHLWSTYLGGTGSDYGYGIVADSLGNVVVTGYTNTYGWISGGYQTVPGGATDGYVIKFTPDGSHLWSTYFGKNRSDYGLGIDVDSSDDIVVTGYTFSDEWVSGGFDTTHDVGSDGFVLKLASAGNHLWSTYIGTDGQDYGRCIAIDSSDEILIAGDTTSAGWLSGGYDTSYDVGRDGFVLKIVERIPGDANGDGKVDGSDVTILANNWQVGVSDGETATWAMGDFNGDGKVDGSDVTILASNWQAGVSSSVAAVSEEEPEEEPPVQTDPTQEFTPPAKAELGVATVPRRSSIASTPLVQPMTVKSVDAALSEPCLSESDVVAIAKDISITTPAKKSIGLHDEIFAMDLGLYDDGQ